MKIQVIYDTEDHSVSVCNDKHVKPLLKNDNEWIKCAERLPLSSKCKLVIDDDRCMFIAYYSGSVENWRESFSQEKLFSITHWCELPEPPEGNE